MAIALVTIPASAKDIHVDPVGTESATGEADAPVKTLRKAVALAKPGDRIVLKAGATFNEGLVLRDWAGDPDRPLIIDGEAALLDGADAIKPSEWTSANNGVFKNETIYKAEKLDKNTILRWYFVIDGSVQRMGRTAKGAKAEFKAQDQLQPGEWTLVGETFYLRLPPEKTLETANIRMPVRSNGVTIAGKSTDIIIRNLNVKNFHNDGFNIHGPGDRIRFENIRAEGCGDDGFSAHETARVEVDGLVATNNATGICEVNQSVAVIRRAVLYDNAAYEFAALHDSHNTLIDSRIGRKDGLPTIVVGSKAEGSPTLRMHNVLVSHTGDTQSELSSIAGSTLVADRVTLDRVSLDVAGQVQWFHSAITGSKQVRLRLRPGATWAAGANRYDVGQLLWQDKRVAPAKLADYQAASGQDADSTWKPLTPGEALPDGIGADETKLPPAPPAR